MLVRVIICATIILTIVTGRIKSGNIETLTDEDDEDYFGEAREATYLRDDFYRKRRSDEEGFYHTLLSRSEPQHVFKRSHGTEDFEHSNAKFITERDWTGSSKISDADRKELESLFSKLNPDDSAEKTDVTRSITDDDNLSPLDGAAKHYSNWLMTQPASQIAAALTQKAQIDNRLTRLFFEKRGLDNLLPTAQPYVAKKVKKSIIKTASAKQNAKVPDLDAKHLIMAGPKLCTDDSPKCLCTRACYPSVALTFSPCTCNAKNKANIPQKTAAPLKNVTAAIQHEDTTKVVGDPYASAWCTSACHPLGVMSENPCKCTGNGETRTNVMAKPAPQAITTPSDDMKLLPKGQASLAPVTQKTEVFPPQAPAAAKAAIFPPQAPAAARVDVFPPQAPAAAKTEIAAQQASSAAPAKVLNPQEPATAKAKITKTVAVSNDTEKANAGQTEKLAKTESPATANSNKSAPADAKSSGTVPSAESGGILSSLGPIYTDSINYQGCYKDRKPVRDLPKRFTRFDTTPEACISECKYQNYKFAGVQYGYLCFCGNAFGRYGKVADKDCNSFCNGDSKRRCGAFWHNSIYSVDGKKYDPTTFDFAKVDDEERLRDKLSPPAVKSVKKSSTKRENHVNIQGVNAATHLMNAAQATLNAAKKLLPGVSKKHKIGKSASRGKRDDDEDDAELMLERENVLGSLKAAHQILQKTNFERYRRNSEKEKRSISEDFDPYDPDDGKDLLKAYMSNVEAYNRQVRSVDDEEEDDDTSDKDNFQYRRLAEADLNDGQFVDKFEDNDHLEEEETEITAKKRSAEKDETESSKKTKSKKIDLKKRSTSAEKRSLPENTEENIIASLKAGSGGGDMKKRSLPEGAAPVVQIHAPIAGSGGGDMKKRSLPEGAAPVVQIHAPIAGSGGGDMKKRSLPEGAAPVVQIHAPIAGSGGGDMKKRSLPEGAAPVIQIHAPIAGSGGGDMKKRSLPEGTAPVVQIHAPVAGSGGGEIKKRSLPDSKQIIGSGLGEKKRRSILEKTNEPAIQKVFSTYESGSMGKIKRRLKLKKQGIVKVNDKESNEKRGMKTQSAVKIPPWDSSDRAKIPPWDASVRADIPPWDRKKRSVEKEEHSRKRRDLASNDVSDGALKMAARSDDINDIEASLQKLESIEKKDVVPNEENASESGSGETDDNGSGEEKESTHEKRSAETDAADDDATKKSKTEGALEPEADAKLKSDVEKGVDSLLNLVVELYKQQKTIKNFENSVRSLRHDILKELNIPSKDKHAATAKVRNAIQKAAKDRLHILTSSIEHKITEFAKSHPESVKQARLATSLLPKIPLSDAKLAESKREIQRRSAEFDNIEDGFDEQNQLPTILKEHFKRNAEADVEDIPEKPKEKSRPKKRSAEDDIDFTRKDEINGEKTLSRMHRDVSESEEEGLDDDYDKLFN